MENEQERLNNIIHAYFFTNPYMIREMKENELYRQLKN